MILCSVLFPISKQQLQKLASVCRHRKTFLNFPRNVRNASPSMVATYLASPCLPLHRITYNQNIQPKLIATPLHTTKQSQVAVATTKTAEWKNKKVHTVRRHVNNNRGGLMTAPYDDCFVFGGHVLRQLDVIATSVSRLHHRAGRQENTLPSPTCCVCAPNAA